MESRTVAVACVVNPTNNVGEASVTVTVDTGTGTTVAQAEAVRPSVLASMRTRPGAMARTRPELETTATVGSLVVQAMVLSRISTPLGSRNVAVKSTDCPTIIVASPGSMVKAELGGLVTVTVADAIRPSTDAKTSAVPAVMAVTVPSSLTLATVGAPVDQVNLRCDNTAPPASRALATSFVVPPITSEAAGGVISKAATGEGVTVTDAFPVFPSLVTVIVADP